MVDTSSFKSAKNLGTTKHQKKSDHKKASGKSNAGSRPQIDDSSSSDESEPGPRLVAQAEEASSTVNGDSRGEQAADSGTAIGAGLKRPLEVNFDGLPTIKRLRIYPEPERPSSDSEPSWNGIQSDFEGNTSEDVKEDREGSDDTSVGGSDMTTDTEYDDRALAFPLSEATTQPMPSRPAFRVRSDFKDWAEQQINEARNFSPARPMTESARSTAAPSLSKAHTLRPPEEDPLPEELKVPGDPVKRQSYSVRVNRLPEVQEARLQLPVVTDEQKIMEAIHNNPVVIVCGSTGSGKTTQAPQFLYEAGYGNPNGPTPGMIGVTQPRRVAAVTMAQRVGHELNNPLASSYQIRFDSTVGQRTAVKFMTDGIMIREIAQDFALTKYSVVIVDEAHERSVNTDILIGLISRIVDLRAKMHRGNSDMKPLKLVIMSATLMTDVFTKNSNLFRDRLPPVVESEGRQYPVTTHFARRTQRDYVEEAIRKVTKAHRKLPKGGILAFMTSQNEIATLSRKLRDSLNADNPTMDGPKLRLAAKEAPLEAEDMELGDERLVFDQNSIDDSETEQNDEDEEFTIQEQDGDGTSKQEGRNLKALILPLYSQLPTTEQLRVFEPPPEDTRLIVLATNVAETSITIPGIRYVFDCGRAKERKHDRRTGVQSFEIGWISKASAAQRTGRAGRTGPGHCYRLYSSAIYERAFKEHTEPEILRVTAEGLVLQLKSMDLQHVVNFPFPSPPDRVSIAKAERLLSYMGALDQDGRVTPLGRNLSAYPVSPRFSRILTIGNQHDCIYLAVAIVAALATPELFVPENQLNLTISSHDNDNVYTQVQRLEDDEKEERRKEYNQVHHSFSSQDKHCDALKLLSAFCAYAWARRNEDADAFCARMFLRAKAMREAYQLFQQLLSLMALNSPGSVDPQRTTIAVPTAIQKSALKQMVAAGFLDQVAIRADLAPAPPDLPHKPRRAIDVPYLTLFPSRDGPAETLDERAVYIHPASLLARAPPKNLPPYLVYASLQRAAPKTADDAETPKTRMHPLTPVGPAQLRALAQGTPLLELGKPIGRVEAVEGERNQRRAWVVPSLMGGAEGRIWPLPAVKVLQRRDKKGDWVVEKVESS